MLIGISISIILIILAIQDIKSRHINGWYLIPLFIFILIQALLQQNNMYVFTNIGFNIAFLSIQFLMVSLFYFVKEKQFNFVNTKLGIGDIGMFLVICIGFSIKSFLFFYILTLIMSIILSIITKEKKQTNNKTIPLVSYIAMNYIIWYWLGVILHKNLVYL